MVHSHSLKDPSSWSFFTSNPCWVLDLSNRTIHVLGSASSHLLPFTHTFPSPGNQRIQVSATQLPISSSRHRTQEEIFPGCDILKRSYSSIQRFYTFLPSEHGDTLLGQCTWENWCNCPKKEETMALVAAPRAERINVSAYFNHSLAHHLGNSGRD